MNGPCVILGVFRRVICMYSGLALGIWRDLYAVWHRASK
jgi:hypothetical protein